MDKQKIRALLVDYLLCFEEEYGSGRSLEELIKEIANERGLQKRAIEVILEIDSGS